MPCFKLTTFAFYKNNEKNEKIITIISFRLYNSWF